MKIRLFSFLLAAILAVPSITGCQAARTMESAPDTLKQTADTTSATVSGKHANPALSMAEAQNIALKHAGFSADQVTALHAEYEIEHGVPQYDVEFHHGAWEYDYEIHADTGEILSYSKDD
ncbi:MAG: PepSY domain-containing protein [Oscillospiraceae bacterium]|nr:PepSY domain-containing protein [Oscillospiraceae bacterium]